MSQSIVNLYFSSALALILALPAPGAQARNSDRQQPMNVTAQRGQSALGDDGEVILEGPVHITQGSLTIEADRATLTRRAGEVVRALLEGSPATLSQLGEDGQPVRASARLIDYDLPGGKVVLTGAVIVQQPRGELRGERVDYDLKTERLDAGGGSGPIHMTIAPKPSGGDE